jgi:cell division GTPase FtsZ
MKVFGIGGAGGNAVDCLARDKIADLPLMQINTK